jgi:large subunit ribosomal protein L34e
VVVIEQTYLHYYYYSVKTPGGKLIVQNTGKKVNSVSNPKYLGGKALHGIKRLDAGERHRSSKLERTVARAYGGVLSHDIVREKYVLFHCVV